MSGFRGFVIAYAGSQPFPALSWAGSRLSVARSVCAPVGQMYWGTVRLWFRGPVSRCHCGPSNPPNKRGTDPAKWEEVHQEAGVSITCLIVRIN